jgi:hypothetical protein
MDILLSAILLFACNKKENQRSTIVNDTLITIPEITTVIKDEKPEIHLQSNILMNVLKK